MAGLQVLQRRLQRALIERGFVTSRALVPEQNLATGTLRVQIVPGRVDGTVEEGRSNGWLRMVLPERQDRLLDQRDLDTAIENLRRLPSERHTEIAIQPSALPGGPELVVKHAGDKPWRGVASLDNTGAPTPLQQGNGFVPRVDGVFETQSIPIGNDLTRSVDRVIDSEAKLLGNVAQRLGENRQATGVINLYSERQACASCESVIQQFRERYPNIVLHFVYRDPTVPPKP